MAGKDKILIFSSTFGEGHQQAARAISEVARLHRQGVETIVFDFMAWAHPLLYPIGHYMYMKGIKAFPSIYGYLFRKTRQSQSLTLKLHFLPEELQRMQRLLEEIQPTVVVSTFPYTAYIISKLKEHGLCKVPSVTVITDYTDHGYWIHPNTDQYIVGSQEVREALQKRGVAKDKIADTGIPIRPEFAHSYSHSMLLEKYGLDPFVPTILIMGGGYGLMGNATSLFHMLATFPQKLQILIVCGHNEKLKGIAEEELKDSQHHIFVTGYIEYVHELMAISDLIVTKPGGVTISEAMAMGLPMLLHHALPGQEQDNADFLKQAGVAIQAKTIEDLQVMLEELISNPLAYLSLKRNVEICKRKQSSLDALFVILQISQHVRNLMPTLV